MPASSFSSPRAILGLLLVGTALLRGEQPASTAAPKVQWEFRTEQQWLASIVAKNLVALGSGAAGPRVDVARDPEGSNNRFLVAIDGRAAEALVLDSDHSVWTPQTYASLAERLVRARRWKADRAEAPAALLQATLDTDDVALQSVNRELSAALTAHPAAPRLHEGAALLLGALALGEAAGQFEDVRELLARMTVHLALADALRPASDASVPGRLARGILLGLSGRQSEALDALAVRPGEQPWPEEAQQIAAATRTRVTLDWRVTLTPETSALERVQIVRALRLRLDPSAAEAFVEQHGPADLPAWGRLLLARPCSVEIGNRYTRDGEAPELGQIDRLYASVHGAALTPAARVTVLRQPASRVLHVEGGSAHVEVVDWPLWAGLLERRLAHKLFGLTDHLKNLGLPDAVDREEARQRAAYGELRVFPQVFALRMGAGWPVHVAFTELLPLWAEPQRFTPEVWMTLRDRLTRSRAQVSIGPENEWFKPGVPVGTVPEDLTPRSSGLLGSPRARREADLVAWRARAPYRRGVAMELLWLRRGDRATADDVSNLLGPFVAHDVPAMQRLAAAAPEGSPLRRDTYRRLCDLLVDQCRGLAWELIEHGNENEGAAAYRRWYFGARDRVQASHGAEWLVDYEWRRGRRAEAFRTAQDALSTGSHSGLVTMADLLERSGQNDEALALYQQAADRYDHAAALLAFYLRHRHDGGAGDDAKAADRILHEVFPRGLERVDAAGLASAGGRPPDGGVAVVGPYAALTRAGVREGDVIVAVDGVRVRDLEQYQTMRYLTRDPAMRLAYWRGDTYLEVQGRFTGRTVANRLRKYPQ